ncbi:MAG TPA: restriction endonuclease [Candidatus Dormibacteraeota bacterium]
MTGEQGDRQDTWSEEQLPPAPSMGLVSFENLDETEFEEFCYDLLIELGFVNVDWRKGTPKSVSPADRGRDLVAHLERKDVDGHKYFETWFVDCKHHKRGIPPDALQGLFTWSEAERPAVALVVASGYLSNPAKDWMDQYATNRHPPFRIRHWERPVLSRMLASRPALMQRHDIIVADSMRTLSEILAAEQEFFDKVWYVRKLILEESIEDGRHNPLPPDIEEQMHAAMRAVEERYGAENVGPWDDWEWGFVNGKLSALRWVLGSEWDFLDT